MHGKVTRRVKRRAEQEPCAGSLPGLALPVETNTGRDTTATATLSTTNAQTSSCSAEDVTCPLTVDSTSSSNLPSATNPRPWLHAGAKPYYLDERSGIAIFLGDCREVLPTLGKFDLLLTDPPYGIGLDTDNARSRSRPFSGERTMKRAVNHPPVAGDDKPFDPSHLLGLGSGAILWGANHYAARLPSSPMWLAWDRESSGHVTDCELAWVSGHRFETVRLFRHQWNGFERASEAGQRVLHPTQKPVALMRWCLSFFPDAKTVVDPYMGSGPVARACKDAGLRYVGIELVEKYCEIAVKRLAQECLF